MKFLAALAQAARALLSSVTRMTTRFCKQTGQWIYERVVEPGIEYGSQAVTGAAQAAVGLVPDVAKAALKLPGQTIRGAGAVVEGGAKLVGQTLGAAARVPGAILGSMSAGAGGGGMPQPPADEGRSERREAMRSAVESVEQAQARRAALKALMPHIPLTPDAEFVRRYALASTRDRVEMDLEELPPHVQEWLNQLDDLQLRKLGRQPQVIEQALLGKKLTGIPMVHIPAGIDPEAERQAHRQEHLARHFRERDEARIEAENVYAMRA